MPTKNVRLPDGRVVAFPDSMSDDAISAVIQKEVGPPKKESAASRFLGSASDSSGLSSIGHAIANPGETLSAINDLPNPNGVIATGVKGAIKNTLDNARQAWQDARSGNPAGAVSHAVSAIPVLGPTMDKAEDQYAKGDIAGEMGTLTGAVGAAGASAAASKIPFRNVPSAVEQAGARFKNSMYPKNLSLTPAEASTQKLIEAIVPDQQAIQRIKGATSEIPDARAYAQRQGLPENGKLDVAKAMRGRADEIQGHYNDKILRPHSGKFQTVPDSYDGEFSGNGKNQATLGQINDRVDAINRELKSNFRKKLKSQTTEAQASDADLNAEKNQLTQILHGKLAEMNGLQPEDIASVRQRAGKLRSLAEEMELSGDKDTLTAGSRASRGSGSVVNKSMDNVTDAISGGPEVVGNRMVKGALEGFEPQETPLPEPVPPDSTQVPTTPEAAQAEFLRQQELEQSSQDAAAARNAEAERLRTQNVDTQRQAAAGEAVKAATGEQTAQDLAAARSRFADAQRKANAATQQTAAQQEALKAYELETAAQDAAANRGTQASEVRQGNAAADHQQVMDEGAALRETGRARIAAARNPTPPVVSSSDPIAQPTIQDQQVIAPDASRGVQPVEVPAPIEAAPAPDTHAFSKSAWSEKNPTGNPDEAADLAKQAGYEVID